jgi:hypothetical protein
MHLDVTFPSMVNLVWTGTSDVCVVATVIDTIELQ